jgi:c-di-GMP-binding flagellar brake protein YcgR
MTVMACEDSVTVGLAGGARRMETMKREDGGAQATTELLIDSGAPEADAERRRAFRRKLPFGRGAVLMVEDRAHIVGVADLSETGAFVSTRAPVQAGETHRLKLLVLPERIEVTLRAEVVRVAQDENESENHPRGVALRFVNVDERSLRSLRTYVAREPKRRSA